MNIERHAAKKVSEEEERRLFENLSPQEILKAKIALQRIKAKSKKAKAEPLSEVYYLDLTRTEQEECKKAVQKIRNPPKPFFSFLFRKKALSAHV